MPTTTSCLPSTSTTPENPGNDGAQPLLVPAVDTAQLREQLGSKPRPQRGIPVRLEPRQSRLQSTEAAETAQTSSEIEMRSVIIIHRQRRLAVIHDPLTPAMTIKLCIIIKHRRKFQTLPHKGPHRRKILATSHSQLNAIMTTGASKERIRHMRVQHHRTDTHTGFYLNRFNWDPMTDGPSKSGSTDPWPGWSPAAPSPTPGSASPSQLQPPAQSE